MRSGVFLFQCTFVATSMIWSVNSKGDTPAPSHCYLLFATFSDQGVIIFNCCQTIPMVPFAPHPHATTCYPSHTVYVVVYALKVYVMHRYCQMWMSERGILPHTQAPSRYMNVYLWRSYFQPRNDGQSNVLLNTWIWNKITCLDEALFIHVFHEVISIEKEVPHHAPSIAGHWLSCSLLLTRHMSKRSPTCMALMIDQASDIRLGRRSLWPSRDHHQCF